MALKNNTLDLKVKKTLLDSYVTQHPVMLVGYLLTGAILVFSFWSTQTQTELLLWYALNCVAVAIMLGFIHTYKNDSQQFTFNSWHWIFISCAVVIGFVWGIFFYFFVQTDDFHALFIATTLTIGVISGGLYATSLLKYAFHAFFLPIIIQFLILVFQEHNLLNISLAVVIFAGILIHISRNIYRCLNVDYSISR